MGWSKESLDIIVRLPYDLIVRAPDYPIRDRPLEEVAKVMTAVVDFPPRPGRLVARWVPDPDGQFGLICVWDSRSGAEASTPRLDP